MGNWPRQLRPDHRKSSLGLSAPKSPTSLWSRLTEAWGEGCPGKASPPPSHCLSLASPPEHADLDSSIQALETFFFSQTWLSVSRIGSKSRGFQPQLCWTVPMTWIGVLCLSFPSQGQLVENASQSDYPQGRKIPALQASLWCLENLQ